jgi:hypothetical protein
MYEYNNNNLYVLQIWESNITPTSKNYTIEYNHAAGNVPQTGSLDE